LLGEAQRAFLERADQRLSQQHERSEAQLKALLHPVGEQIKSYDTRIGEIERARTEAYGELKGLMDSMRVGQERVQAEAQRLVTSLRAGPKTRGRWGGATASQRPRNGGHVRTCRFPNRGER
jgi:DNA recombination protein RmuC